MANILQLRMRLEGIEPEIWRRFLVKDSDTFEQLHRTIQKIMGWENYHMYEFKVGNVIFEGSGDSFCVDSMWGGSSGKKINPKKAKLSDHLDEEKIEFEYTYDFGDNWMHTILIEKIIPDDSQKYPFCMEGERACPPEDCGSVYGYHELMDIRKNKKHKEYEERIVEWLGEEYDPEKFNADKVNKQLGSYRKRALPQTNMLKKSVTLESKNEFDNALLVISDILKNNPESYHGHFLKARIERKKGGKDIDALKNALAFGIKEEAGSEVFDLIDKEFKHYGIEKNQLIISDFLDRFHEKDEEMIEKAFGFDYYLEVKDRMLLGKDQNHKDIIDAFFEFSGAKKMIAIKEEDGTVKEMLEMNSDKIRENLLLLEENKGIFYDEDIGINYSFLSKDFFACIMSNMLFFSANQENTLCMANILDKHGIIYFEPENIKEM